MVIKHKWAQMGTNQKLVFGPMLVPEQTERKILQLTLANEVSGKFNSLAKAKMQQMVMINLSHKTIPDIALNSCIIHHKTLVYFHYLRPGLVAHD